MTDTELNGSKHLGISSALELRYYELELLLSSSSKL